LDVLEEVLIEVKDAEAGIECRHQREADRRDGRALATRGRGMEGVWGGVSESRALGVQRRPPSRVSAPAQPDGSRETDTFIVAYKSFADSDFFRTAGPPCRPPCYNAPVGASGDERAMR